ncbi:aminotransferase class V-fold PLP-dependent enzyme [Ruminococcaceae bacterium OttesenSCG-928-D13]|nr:aminotransferase class V-fold PLP-dependent enzyme [Ruminococcaceae bacterium OttesenSCG-928-D13]
MIYFDNAATTLPKPEAVKAAVLLAMDSCGNPARGAHGAAMNALRTLLAGREAVAGFFGVPGAENVAFTPNATAALNLAIGAVRGHIVTTGAEHNSVLRPVHRRGNYTVVSLDALGRLDFDRLEAAIRPDTGAVVMTHASNLTGNVYDIAAAGRLCRAKGVRLIVDAAQSAGLLPIEMEKLGLSALCFSGHKSLYGPQGIGALCLAPDFRPEPCFVGGSGSDSFSPEHPGRMPERLEAGTQNAHGVAGLRAGIEYVKARAGACFAEADQLARRFTSGVRNLAAYTLYGDLDAQLRAPVVALNHRRMESAELALKLDDGYGIAVRAGAHCAPLMHKALGTGEAGAVRFSFSHFNTADEVDTALEALEVLAR